MDLRHTRMQPFAGDPRDPALYRPNPPKHPLIARPSRQRKRLSPKAPPMPKPSETEVNWYIVGFVCAILVTLAGCVLKVKHWL